MGNFTVPHLVLIFMVLRATLLIRHPLQRCGTRLGRKTRDTQRWSIRNLLLLHHICLSAILALLSVNTWVVCRSVSRSGQSLQIDVPDWDSGTSIRQHQSILNGSIFYLHDAPLYLLSSSSSSPSFYMTDWISLLAFLYCNIDSPFSVSLSSPVSLVFLLPVFPLTSILPTNPP